MLTTETITTLIESVRYETDGRYFVVAFNNGSELRVPISLLRMELWDGQQIKSAPTPTDEQLSEVRVWSGGRSIDIDCIKQNFGIEQLLKAVAS